MKPTQAIGAVDIGGTKIAVGVVAPDGRIYRRYEFPTGDEPDPEAALRRMANLLRKGMAETGTSLEGIGIGATGPVDPQTGVFGNVEFLPGWEGFNIVQAFDEALGLPAAVENDADAAALGEAAWGAGRGWVRFVYVTVSTGIGVGLVFDGQLYRGLEGAHPEIGHMLIDPSGPACSCGFHGCWESLASGTGVSSLYQRETGQALKAAEIYAQAEAGDATALKVVDRAAGYLGMGLANLVTVFVPEVIALGGGVMGSRHLFWERLKTDIACCCSYVPAARVRLEPAGLGEDTGLAGAASVWLHHLGRLGQQASQPETRH